jgi:3-hydroxybutyryl-CoA dehydrogenase
MTIYVIGDRHQTGVIKDKVAGRHQLKSVNKQEGIEDHIDTVVFDFMFDGSPDDLEVYVELNNIHLIVNSTRYSLSETAFLMDGPLPNLYGIAGDETFLERPLLEISEYHRNTVNGRELLSKLDMEGVVVDDRVGMVTPRIIAMIINEAYYTVMEGTANREDIDTGMKLGTNYPMGPFEWTSKWGLDKIYELLEALYLDTKDERYKICPLLKQEYLKLV